MAIVTASVLAACGTKPEDKENRAKAALEQKYHKEFEITEVYPQKFGDLYYEVQAYALDEPQVRFTAAIDTEDDNISDSYVERRVCAAISRQAEENLDGLPGYYYLSVRAQGPQPITADAGISIKDYVAMNSYNRFLIEVYVVPESKDGALFYQSLAGLLKNLDFLPGVARLVLVTEEQSQAVQAYFELHDTTDAEYRRLTEPFFSVDIPYQNGLIDMTEAEFIAAVGGAL